MTTKKQLVARGIAGALSLIGVIGAVGCSSEPLSPEEAAAIGSTSEALSISAAPGTPSFPAGEGRTRMGYCTITVPTVGGVAAHDVLIAAGGFKTAAGATTNEIWKMDLTSGGSWTKLTPTLNASVANLRGIKISATECLFIGGDNNAGGAASTNVDRLSVNGSGVFAVAAAQALATGVADFEVEKCVDNSGTRVVVFGGTSSGTNQNKIQISNALVPSAAWDQTRTLLRGRSDYGLVKTANNQYVLAGGSTTSSGFDNDIEILEMSTTDCDAALPGQYHSAVAGERLSSGVKGNVAFKDASAGTAILAAGSTGAALPTTVDHLTPSGSGGTLAFTLSKNASTLPTGVYKPQILTTSSGEHVMVGGGNDDTPTAAVQVVQQFVDATGWSSATTNFTAVFFPALGEISGKLYAASGQTGFTAGALTYSLGVQEISFP